MKNYSVSGSGTDEKSPCMLKQDWWKNHSVSGSGIDDIRLMYRSLYASNCI